MTEKIIGTETTEKGPDQWMENKILHTQIELQDIMTLVEKLWEEWRQVFLHNLSQQENLSENVFNLLIKHIDSKILFNLCNNTAVSWNILDIIVQKIIGIAQGTEQIPWVIENNEVYYVEEEDEEWRAFVVNDTSPYIECILKNVHLRTQHIEDIMNVFQWSMNHWFQVNICSNPNTPSWILEKMYETNPHNLMDVVFDNPNLSETCRIKIQAIKNQNHEKNKIKQHIEDIKEKHPELDIYQILAYYENKKDKETSLLIAGYLYNYNLGHFRYWSKIHHEKLQLKLKLAQKYAMSEECKLRILYDMIGESIVNDWSLMIYEKFDDDPIYITIPEAEEKYGVKIDQEHIKIVCQDILKEMLWRTNPQFKDVENAYTFAQNMDIEIPDINTQYYIKARMSVINNRRSNRFTTNDMSEHFKKLLELMVENKRMFSVSEVENYVQDMNTFTFPIWGVNDIFEVITKLELSDEFTHDIVIKELKKCFRYNHKKWKLLMQRFAIDLEEIIQIIIGLKETSGGEEIDECGWCFAMDKDSSLEYCLDTYGIDHDKVIPYMIDDIKKELIEDIQKKDYDRAQTIIDKYTVWANWMFDEQREVLTILTNK